MLRCKAKRKYLLTWKVSIYCLLSLQSSIAMHGFSDGRRSHALLHKEDEKGMVPVNMVNIILPHNHTQKHTHSKNTFNNIAIVTMRTTLNAVPHAHFCEVDKSSVIMSSRKIFSSVSVNRRGKRKYAVSRGARARATQRSHGRCSLVSNNSSWPLS